MFHKIIDIKPLAGMLLQARFTDGELKTYDVSPLLNQFPEFYSLIEIPGLFELVHLDAGGYGVVWNEDIDLAAEEIWQNGSLVNS